MTIVFSRQDRQVCIPKTPAQRQFEWNRSLLDFFRSRYSVLPADQYSAEMAFLYGVVKGAEVLRREQKKNRARNSLISASGSISEEDGRSTLTIEPDWWDNDSTAPSVPQLIRVDKQAKPSVKTIAMENLEKLPSNEIFATKKDELNQEQTTAITAATTEREVKRKRPPIRKEATAGSFSAAELQHTKYRIEDDQKTDSAQPSQIIVPSKPGYGPKTINTGSYFEQLQREKSSRSSACLNESNAASDRFQRPEARPRAQTLPTVKRANVEGPRQNFSTVAESENRRRSRNSIKTLDPSGKQGLKNNVISTPTAGSFMEAAATVKDKLPKDSEVASWEKFISSVSQDHKNETKRG